MTDHTDLLGGTRTGKPSRVPRKIPPVEVTQAAPPATPKPLTFIDYPYAGESPPVLASTKQTDIFDPHAKDVIDTVGDGFTGYRPVAEADGSTSIELPPVSTEYAAAQANRPIIIGQTSREYAYKRILRTGKRL